MGPDVTLLERLNRPGFVLLTVAVVAGILRLTALSRPPQLIFDETYYAKSGCLFIGGSLQECEIRSDDEEYWVEDKDDVGSWVHPPVGKWMIGLGELGFGMTPVGWRIAAAIAGVLGVVITAAMALLLFRSNVWALVTGLLLSTESLHFVQSRVALLDIFVALWVVLGFTVLLLDRRWIERRDTRLSEEKAVADTREGPTARQVVELRPVISSPLWRPWRFAAGASFGLAAATKWSGANALIGAIALSFIWERTRRRAAGVNHPIGRTAWQEGFGILLALVFVPIAVYIASWARWWTMHGVDIVGWWQLHVDMYDFHVGLGRFEEGTRDLVHPYSSQPWTWILTLRPVNFYFVEPGASVLSIGNPVIFWSSIVAIPYAVVSWWRKRDYRGGFITVAIMAQWLPWFGFANRVQFLFYMTPIVPFMVLAVVYGLRRLSDYRPEGATRHPFRPVAVGFVALSMTVFAFFYPILTGFPLSKWAWSIRIWLRTLWV